MHILHLNQRNQRNQILFQFLRGKKKKKEGENSPISPPLDPHLHLIYAPPLTKFSEEVYKKMEFLKVVGLKNRFSERIKK